MSCRPVREGWMWSSSDHVMRNVLSAPFQLNSKAERLDQRHKATLHPSIPGNIRRSFFCDWKNIEVQRKLNSIDFYWKQTLQNPHISVLHRRTKALQVWYEVNSLHFWEKCYLGWTFRISSPDFLLGLTPSILFIGCFGVTFNQTKTTEQCECRLCYLSRDLVWNSTGDRHIWEAQASVCSSNLLAAQEKQMSFLWAGDRRMQECEKNQVNWRGKVWSWVKKEKNTSVRVRERVSER